MITEYMAACPYCGQMVAVTGNGRMTPEELGETAGQKCLCDGAKRERKLRDSIDRINMVCGSASTDNGFEYPLADHEIAMLRRLTEDIIDGHADNVKLRMMSGDEVRLLDAIGYVKVKRTHKKQFEM